MAENTVECTGCGKETIIRIPDEIDGFLQVAWECPDHECSTKNFTEGVTPAELALAEARNNDTDEEGVVTIGDGDAGSIGDIN